MQEEGHWFWSWMWSCNVISLKFYYYKLPDRNKSWGGKAGNSYVNKKKQETKSPCVTDHFLAATLSVYLIQESSRNKINVFVDLLLWVIIHFPWNTKTPPKLLFSLSFFILISGHTNLCWKKYARKMLSPYHSILKKYK